MKRYIEYNDLTERPHYASIVDSLEVDKYKTNYPFDRTASILRISPYFTQLEGAHGIDPQDFERRLEKDKLRTILLREQASSTGLTVPEAKAKAAAKRGPIVHDLVANDLVAAEEPLEEMFTASSGTESSWRGSTSGLVTKKLSSKTVIDNLLEKIRRIPESEAYRNLKETSDLAGEDDPWHNPDKLTKLDKKMSEYKGKGKGKEERINIDTVLDDFNRITLGKSRGRGSNDPAPNERETRENKPRRTKKAENPKKLTTKKVSIGKSQKKLAKIDAMDTT
jgi:hypothetical protein